MPQLLIDMAALKRAASGNDNEMVPVSRRWLAEVEARLIDGAECRQVLEQIAGVNEMQAAA